MPLVAPRRRRSAAVVQVPVVVRANAVPNVPPSGARKASRIALRAGPPLLVDADEVGAPDGHGRRVGAHGRRAVAQAQPPGREELQVAHGRAGVGQEHDPWRAAGDRHDAEAHRDPRVVGRGEPFLEVARRVGEPARGRAVDRRRGLERDGPALAVEARRRVEQAALEGDVLDPGAAARGCRRWRRGRCGRRRGRRRRASVWASVSAWDSASGPGLAWASASGSVWASDSGSASGQAWASVSGWASGSAWVRARRPRRAGAAGARRPAGSSNTRCWCCPGSARSRPARRP